MKCSYTKIDTLNSKQFVDYNSDYKMGTRSRLVIHRRTKKPIMLWMRWDGYFEGVGSWLCKEIKNLLQKYSIEQIETMLEVLNLDDVEGYQCFSTADLIPFIEGKTKYMNTNCDDIEYEYILNFQSRTFVGIGHGETCALSFDMILAGKELVGGDYEEPVHAVSDKANVVFEMTAAAFKTLTESEKSNVIDRLKRL